MRRAMAITMVTAAIFAVWLPARAFGYGGPAFGAGSGGPGGGMVSVDDALQEAIHAEEASGDLDGAITNYKAVIDTYRTQKQMADRMRPSAVTAMLRLAAALEKKGRKGEAIGQYVALTDEFGDTPEAAEARKRLAALGIELPTTTGANTSLEARLKTILKTESPVSVSPLLADIFAQIASDSGVNVVTDPPGLMRPPGTMPPKLRLNGLSVEEALDIVTKSSGVPLDWTVYSGTVYVASPEKIAELKAEEEAKRQPQLGYLRDEMKLLDEKLKIAKRALDKAEELQRAGSLSLGQVDEEKLKVIAAQQELLNAKRKLDSVRQALMDGGVTAGVPAVVEVKSSGPDDGLDAFRESLGEPGYTVVTLYRSGLRNFTGPQGLDLDTGETYQMTTKWGGDSEKRLFEEHPQCSLLLASVIVYIRNEPVNSLVFFVNNSVKVAMLSKYASIDTLPDEIQYDAPNHGGGAIGTDSPWFTTAGFPAVSLETEKFVFATAKGEYFVKVTHSSDGDRALVAYMRIPKELANWRDPMARRALHEKSVRLDAERRTADRQAAIEKRRLERPRATDAAAKSPVQPTLHGVKLFTDSARPRALDLETERTVKIPEGMDAVSFFNANPDFDIVAVNGALLLNKGLEVGMIRNNPDGLPEGTPAQGIEYVKLVPGEPVDDIRQLPVELPEAFRDAAGYGGVSWNAGGFVIRTTDTVYFVGPRVKPSEGTVLIAYEESPSAMPSPVKEDLSGEAARIKVAEEVIIAPTSERAGGAVSSESSVKAEE